MEKHECPTCKGSKKMTVTAQLYNGKGFTPQPPVEMDCFTCNAKGFLTQAEVDEKEAAKKIWCKCEDHPYAIHHEDGDTQEYPGGFIIDKHHYSCTKCGLVQQIG